MVALSNVRISMKLPASFRWPRFTSLPLALEITLVLLVKIAILFAIKKAFFSNPQAKKMLVPMPQVEQHLLSGTVHKVDSPGTLTANQLAETTKITPPQEQHGSN